MSLKLLAIAPLAPNGIQASYEVFHSTPGREGTCLAQIAKMTIYPEKTAVEMNIPDCDAPTPEEALTRLSGWLRRLADGIDARDGSIKIPLS